MEKWRRLLTLWSYAIDNQIPGNLAIHSDAQAAILCVRHTGTGLGQDQAIRVVQTVQRRLKQIWRTRIQGILMEMRGPISSLEMQLQRNEKGEHLLHGSKNGSHSTLQWQRILKLTKEKNLLLHQHRRNPPWIELRTGSLGPLHRFGLGIVCVHHMSNELGKIGKSRFRTNAGDVASIGRLLA
jgi:hypothetical protein